jgi:glycine cleavage system H protein
MEAKIYTEDHEWLAKDGEEWVLGVSMYAQEQLGDVVYVSLPSEGEVFAKGAGLCVIESVKAASDVYAPVGLRVVKVNGSLLDKPELVNEDAEGAGWLVRVVVDGGEEVEGMSEGEYAAKFGN